MSCIFIYRSIIQLTNYIDVCLLLVKSPRHALRRERKRILPLLMWNSWFCSSIESFRSWIILSRLHFKFSKSVNPFWSDAIFWTAIIHARATFCLILPEVHSSSCCSSYCLFVVMAEPKVSEPLNQSEETVEKVQFRSIWYNYVWRHLLTKCGHSICMKRKRVMKRHCYVCLTVKVLC